MSSGGNGTAPPVVEASHVTKRFGATVALDDVGITVRPGEAHALVGRNGAGKSTLVSILTGLQAADAGELTFGGSPAPAPGDREAWRSVVACVYQQSTILPRLTVAENLFLNRQSESWHRPIGWKRLRAHAAELLASWQLDVDVRRPAGDLSVEQRQIVEIARALSLGARFIILDEPTARLDAAAIGRLFDRLGTLRRQGVTFLYISHHLQEIFEICQTVTVFRDARHIVTAPVASLSRRELVTAMTGEPVSERTDPRPPRPSRTEPALAVEDVTVDGACRDVSLTVDPGEILGLAGGGSSGKFAVAETIVGLRRPSSGTVRLAGRRQRLGDVPAALAAGVGFVPQDRHHEGLVPGLSVAENLTMSVPHRLGSYGYLSPRRRRQAAEAGIDRLGLVTSGPPQPVADLSGGNQQKVVMGRALADDPRVLVLMAPTAGVDVKSKEALMSLAVSAAREGTAVLVVTDDLEDLRYCHRVVVMFRGATVAELDGTWDDTALVAAMEGVDA